MGHDSENESNSFSESENEHVARANTRPKPVSEDKENPSKAPTKSGSVGDACLKELKDMRQDFNCFTDRLTKVEKEVFENKRPYQKRFPNTPNRNSKPAGDKRGACFKCGQVGHFIRDCSVTGQIQITQNPNPQGSSNVEKTAQKNTNSSN